jgi:hypothetical protein
VPPNSPEEGLGATILTFAREHPTLVATAALVALVVLRVTLVTRGNVTSATALVASAGVVQVGLSTLLWVFPGVANFLFVMGGILTIDLIRRVTPLTLWHLWLLAFIPLALYVFTLSSLMYWAVTLIMVSVIGWIRQRHLTVKVPYLYVNILWALPFFVVLSLDTPVWMPAEIVDRGNDGPIVGYIVEREPDWTTILEEEDRRIIHVPSKGIEGMTVCQTPRDARSSRTFYEWANPEDRTEYPPCNADQ